MAVFVVLDASRSICCDLFFIVSTFWSTCPRQFNNHSNWVLVVESEVFQICFCSCICYSRIKGQCKKTLNESQKQEIKATEVARRIE
jgi:hypothetical protein